MKPTGMLAAALLALAAHTTASAALVDRGGGLIYDTEHDITWLADPAQLPGPSDRQTAAQFASDFVYAGGSDWLLPLTPFFDSSCAGSEGFGCIDSQMGHLFHARLGGQPGQSVFDDSGDAAAEIANVALFPTLVADWFWSWQIADDGGNTAFAFHFGTGEQLIRDSDLTGHVLLMHAGDLGASANPVDSPPTLPLVLAATALALVTRPRRRAPPANAPARR